LTFEKVAVAPIVSQPSLLTMALQHGLKGPAPSTSPSSCPSASSSPARLPRSNAAPVAATTSVSSSATATVTTAAPTTTLATQSKKPTKESKTEEDEEDWGPSMDIITLLKETQRDMKRLGDREREHSSFLIADEVLNDRLFLGGARVAAHEEGLRDLGVNAIVNVTNLVMDHFPGWIRYFRVPVLDEEDEDLLTWFPETTAFIHSCILAKKTVLVHCQAGVSRSATVVCAYLMRYGGLTFEEALDHTVRCRPCACPNIGFITQLQRFQTQLAISRRRAAVLSSNSSLTSIVSSPDDDGVVENPLPLVQANEKNEPILDGNA